MEPLKPFPSADIFVGRFDASILPFLPEKSAYRDLIQRGDFVACKYHLLGRGDKFIKVGDPVVAVRWPSGGSGRQTFSVAFYCSVACQRSHAANALTWTRKKPSN